LSNSSLNLFSLRRHLGEAGALITFSGSFSHSLIEELGVAVRKYLETDHVQKSAMMDVFSVYVEASQNVRNYTALRLSKGDISIGQSSIVVIAKRETHYEVNAGNMIEVGDVPCLRERLETLRKADKPALKAMYKEQLRKERAPGAVGAGLGLIDMARRSSAPLEFDFTDIDSDYSFFSLRVII
jgi:hypothetical protein